MLKKFTFIFKKIEFSFKARKDKIEASPCLDRENYFFFEICGNYSNKAFQRASLSTNFDSA